MPEPPDPYREIHAQIAAKHGEFRLAEGQLTSVNVELRLRRMERLRRLTMGRYRERCAALGLPDRFGIEYIKRRAEPSVHRPDPVEIWEEIESLPAPKRRK